MEDLHACGMFDEFPEPVLLSREGTILYENSAARRAFPGAPTGAELPEALAFCVRGRAVTAEAVGGSYAVTATEAMGGTLLVLRREVALPVSLTALSDQLRLKMTNMMASARLLSGAVERLGEQNATRYLATLNQSLYRMLRMIGDLELAGQVQEQEDCYHPAIMDMAGFCHELAQAVAPLAREAGVAFSYDSTEASLITVGDAALLRRMLLSLFSNAIKAAARGSMGFKLARNKGRVLLTVWDDGRGLTSADLAAYFNGGGDGAPTPGAGLGLGLPIVRRVAELHGGTVMVESREGEGLKAVVSLPIETPEHVMLRSAPANFDRSGGFSPLLVELSDALPWQVFLPQDLE